jgi:hypothetical protein
MEELFRLDLLPIEIIDRVVVLLDGAAICATANVWPWLRGLDVIWKHIMFELKCDGSYRTGTLFRRAISSLWIVQKYDEINQLEAARTRRRTFTTLMDMYIFRAELDEKIKEISENISQSLKETTSSIIARDNVGDFHQWTSNYIRVPDKKLLEYTCTVGSVKITKYLCEKIDAGVVFGEKILFNYIKRIRNYQIPVSRFRHTAVRKIFESFVDDGQFESAKRMLEWSGEPIKYAKCGTVINKAFANYDYDTMEFLIENKIFKYDTNKLYRRFIGRITDNKRGIFKWIIYNIDFAAQSRTNNYQLLRKIIILQDVELMRYVVDKYKYTCDEIIDTTCKYNTLFTACKYDKNILKFLINRFNLSSRIGTFRYCLLYTACSHLNVESAKYLYSNWSHLYPKSYWDNEFINNIVGKPKSFEMIKWLDQNFKIVFDVRHIAAAYVAEDIQTVELINKQRPFSMNEIFSEINPLAKYCIENESIVMKKMERVLRTKDINLIKLYFQPDKLFIIDRHPHIKLFSCMVYTEYQEFVALCTRDVHMVCKTLDLDIRKFERPYKFMLL